MTISRLDDGRAVGRDPHRPRATASSRGYIDRLSIRTPSGRHPGPQPVRRQPAEGHLREVAATPSAGSCSSTSRRVASTSGRSARSTALLRDLAARGVAIVMVSSELPEVIGISDRIMVMREGRDRGARSTRPRPPRRGSCRYATRGRGMTTTASRPSIGRDLVAELPAFVHRPYLVVTMDDLWPMFAAAARRSVTSPACTPSARWSSTSSRPGCDALPACASVIGLGGGQAVDVAKFFAWRREHAAVPGADGDDRQRAVRAPRRAARGRPRALPRVRRSRRPSTSTST